MIRAIRGEAELEAITTHPKHIKFGGVPDVAEVKARVVVERDTIFRNDLNNVDLDREVVDMHKNALHYHALCNRVSGKFRGLISLIREARP
jgi:flagellar basal-body rod protein FlgB